MDKPVKLSGQSKAEPTAPPHQQPEPAQPESPSVPPYRIICNSEHFIVLNPVQRTKPKKAVRADDGHKRTGPVILWRERKGDQTNQEDEGKMLVSD